MEAKGNGRAGIANLGFGDGFYLEEGESYLFTCYARALDEKGCALLVSVEDTGTSAGADHAAGEGIPAGEKHCCASAAFAVRGASTSGSAILYRQEPRAEEGV